MIPRIRPGIDNHQRTKYDIKEKTIDIIPKNCTVTLDTPFYEKSIPPPVMSITYNFFIIFRKLLFP